MAIGLLRPYIGGDPMRIVGMSADRD